MQTEGPANASRRVLTFLSQRLVSAFSEDFQPVHNLKEAYTIWRGMLMQHIVPNFHRDVVSTVKTSGPLRDGLDWCQRFWIAFTNHPETLTNFFISLSIPAFLSSASLTPATSDETGVTRVS